MTDTRVIDTKMSSEGEAMRPITSLDSDISPTAASAFNPLFGPSGAMRYRVVMRDGQVTDVTAATGDEAAVAALHVYPAGFVMTVNPAPKAN